MARGSHMSLPVALKTGSDFRRHSTSIVFLGSLDWALWSQHAPEATLTSQCSQENEAIEPDAGPQAPAIQVRPLSPEKLPSELGNKVGAPDEKPLPRLIIREVSFLTES